MIAAVKLVNTSITSCSYRVGVDVWVVRTFKIYSLSDFQVNNT